MHCDELSSHCRRSFLLAPPSSLPNFMLYSVLLLNELEDNIAKRLLGLSYTTQISVSTDDFRRRINCKFNAYYIILWQIPVSLSIVLSLPPYCSLPRREQIVVTLLYLRTCFLTHLHWFTHSTCGFTRSPPAECPSCSIPWSYLPCLETRS